MMEQASSDKQHGNQKILGASGAQLHSLYPSAHELSSGIQ